MRLGKGQKSISLTEVLSQRLSGILLPSNTEAVTFPSAPTTREKGLYKGVAKVEKSPCRHESGAVVYRYRSVRRLLNPSKFDIKNSRSFPLNSLGIRTGPPSVKPY